MNALLYSASTNGFHHPVRSAGSIPDDAVEVTIKRHSQILAAVAGGKRMVPGPDGYPLLIDPPASLAPTLEQQRAARAAAYRAESDPLFFMAQRGEATEQDWRDKIAEIRARFPYPADPA